MMSQQACRRAARRRSSCLKLWCAAIKLCLVVEQPDHHPRGLIEQLGSNINTVWSCVRSTIACATLSSWIDFASFGQHAGARDNFNAFRLGAVRPRPRA